jgi:NDP-sugar pyrophosphorylase family protein
MQAVILAGGRGSRMGDLCGASPKPLIKILGKSLILYTLEALPVSIDEIIIVVGYLGEDIKSFLGDSFRGIKITYIQQEVFGTGGALIAAKNVLKEMFFVVNADDIYGKGELESFTKVKAMYGITYGIPNQVVPEKVLFTEDGLFKGRELVGLGCARWFGTGAYVLPTEIFSSKWEILPSGELSIPHSLVNQKFTIYVQPINRWLPVNTLEQMKKAKKEIAGW